MFEFLPLGFSTPAVLLAAGRAAGALAAAARDAAAAAAHRFPAAEADPGPVPRQETPARTPWWLLLLRLIVAALVILAMAGPVWNAGKDAVGRQRARCCSWWTMAGPPPATGPTASTPPRSWSAARPAPTGPSPSWRPARPCPRSRWPTPAARWSGCAPSRPRRTTPDRHGQLAAAAALPGREPGAEIIWISDGVTVGEQRRLRQRRSAAHRRRTGRSPSSPGRRRGRSRSPGVENTAAGLTVRVLRAEPNGRDAGVVRASDRRGLPLGETPFSFAAGATETTAT